MPANLPVAFAALLAGGLLMQKGVEAARGSFSGPSASSATLSPSGQVVSGSEQAQVRQEAARFGVSPQTLWGVYGTESDFGANPSTSSAGARGPFQFIQSTWERWGKGSIMNFTDSLEAAARYLRSLGANVEPDSPATLAALNAYNGNGGGSSQTSYTESVLRLGGQF